MSRTIEKFSPTNFDTMYNGSWFTIEGAGGDCWEWVDGLTKLLEEKDIGTPCDWMYFSGEEMNNQYSLTGDNAYPDDLHFIAFSLDGLNNISTLAIFKMEIGGRWFDDIVDNNAIREAESNKDK